MYGRIIRWCCPKFTHEVEDISIEEMCRASASWSNLEDVSSPRMSMAGERARVEVVDRTKEDFAAVKAPKNVAASHRLDQGKIVMQRNMLARRMVASILKGELDMVAEAPQRAGSMRTADNDNGGDGMGLNQSLNLADNVGAIIACGNADLMAAWNEVGTDDERHFG